MGTAFQFFCRFLISFGKFGFAIFLSKAATLEVVGLYGLIAGMTPILVQFAGLEIQQVNVRRVLGGQQSPWPLVVNQLKFHAVSHLVIALITAGGAVALGLDPGLVPLVIALVIADHLSLESYRFMVALQRPALATLILALKSTGWMLLYIFLVWIGWLQIGIASILIFWSISAAVGFGVFVGLTGAHLSLRQWLVRIDGAEIRASIWQAWPFLLTAVTYAIAQSMDRVFINARFGVEQVGVYFLYLSLASGATTLVLYPASLLFYPKAVTAFLRGDLDGYTRYKRQMLKTYWVLGAAVVAASAIILPWLLASLGKNEYIGQIRLFWLLLAAQALLVGADYVLIDVYVRKLDRQSMMATICATLIFILAMNFMPIHLGLVGIAFGVCIFYGALWATRSIALMLAR